MDWVTLIVALCTSGGIFYLIIDKIFTRKQDNANTQSTVISNSNEIADLYNKIREIVNEETEPIKSELKEIKDNWCCYREECEMRLMMKPKDHNALGN